MNRPGSEFTPGRYTKNIPAPNETTLAWKARNLAMAEGLAGGRVELDAERLRPSWEAGDKPLYCCSGVRRSRISVAESFKKLREKYTPRPQPKSRSVLLLVLRR